MSLLQHALRAGRSASDARPSARRRVLVVGGAGALGAAVLEQLLAGGAFVQVGVLVNQPVSVAVRGLAVVHESVLDHAGADVSEDTAVIVFDRERHANGREQAFVRPQPDALPVLAAALQRRGVRSLLVVMPHAAASLPEALKRGLANLDEQSVATLGFDHLVFIRSAQMTAGARSARMLQRIADWVLAQMRIMIAQRDKPVRPVKVAQFTAALAALLPESERGTRVVPPELVWEAAQTRDVPRLARNWLHGEDTPATTPRRMRM